MDPRHDPADILRPLRRTRQVREFTSEPVDRAALDALADVGRWSGSSRNSQPWRFLIITDESTIRALAAAGHPQTRSLTTAMAAIAITLPTEVSEVSAAYDDGRAAERMLIGAGMLGLSAGIAWVRGDVRDGIREILALPADRYVRTIIALGHPTEAAQAPKSAPGAARLPREETVRYERWSED